MAERRTFFEMPVEASGFDRAFTDVLSSFKRGGMTSMLGEQNIQRFSHGRRWRHRTADRTSQGEMRTLAVEWSCPYQSVIDGDLDLIPQSFLTIISQMNEAQQRMIYQTLSDVCEENGQTVDAATLESNAAAFLEMLNRVEFSVDRQGNVSLPEIHAGEAAAKAMIKTLEAQPPEFSAEVERIKAEKTEAALARERERKGRFKSAASQ